MPTEESTLTDIATVNPHETTAEAVTITIEHSHAEGTLVTGDPRPHQHHLKHAGFRWSRRMGQWYFPRSRDRDGHAGLIDLVANGLRAEGFDVEVSIDNTPRDRAVVEEDAAERSEQRAEALAAKAERTAEKASAAFSEGKAIADMIPMGQPILVGHHSERRHRRDLDRIDRKMSQGVELHQEAKEAERQAGAAVARQEQHESLGTTLRRIEKLEADIRLLDRRLGSCELSGVELGTAEGLELSCTICSAKVTITDGKIPAHGGATGDDAARWTAERERMIADVAYWREHVEGLENNGAKLWGKADFQPGDRVNRDLTVVKVNAKSLSCVADVMPQFSNPLPYHKVQSKQDLTGDERAAFLATAKAGLSRS